MRKLAICARVTGCWGQKRNDSCEQPVVMPDANSASMLGACTLPGSTSLNPADSPGTCSPSARVKNVAICARVTGCWGQKRNDSCEQPVVMPDANSASMLAACTLPGSTSLNPADSPGTCSPSARVKNVAICARVTGCWGQKRNDSCEQPVVMPDANSASMLAA